MANQESVVCFVVGVGSVLVMEMNMSQSVAWLKEKIKEKEPNCVHCNADQLTLYLAKRDDGTWLNCDDKDARASKKTIREVPEEIQKMMLEKEPMVALDDGFYFTKAFAPSRTRGQEIHILVQLPEVIEVDVSYYEDKAAVGIVLMTGVVLARSLLLLLSDTTEWKSRVLLLQSLALAVSMVLYAIGLFSYWQSRRVGGGSSAHTFDVMIAVWIIVITLFFLLKGAKSYCESKIEEVSARVGYKSIP